MTSNEASAEGKASDYRSQPASGQPSRRTNWSNIVQNSMYPDKEQGLIIDGKDYSTSLERYVEALATIVSPRNIIYASKISNSRVCIFLSSKQLVDEVTDKYKSINIDGSEQNMRPFVSKQRRVVLSNVYPMIPNVVIEEELDKLNVVRSSNVSFLRAGFGKEEFTHILSFRRQMYVPEDSLNKIPDSMVVEYKGERNWIYISYGTIKCYQCKEEGHVARNCKNVDNINSNITADLAQDTNRNVEHNHNDNSTFDEDFPLIETGKTAKRTLSQITNTSSNKTSEPPLNSSEERAQEFAKPVKKKKKKCNRENNSENKSEKKNISEQLAPVKEKLEETSKVLNYEQLKDFLEDTYGTSKALQISLNYTKETDKLIALLRDIYPLLVDRGMKSRFTRIMKRLKDPVASDSSRASSENECLSSEEE